MHSLIDASPFVVKAEIMLKMAGLEYEVDYDGFNKAPKGKLPYINDDGKVIADSVFIRIHIEDKYKFDFDAGLDERQRGIAWAIEKMVEDHLYWAMVRERWLEDDNFNKGPRAFFDKAPALIRPLIAAMVQKKIRKNVYAQGLGRHTRNEANMLAGRAVDGLAAILGERQFIMSDQPCGADAMIFANLASMAEPAFNSPMIDKINSHANLEAYLKRMKQRYFPDVQG